MAVLVVIAAFILVLLSAAALKKRRAPAANAVAPAYVPQPALLSKAERSFFGVLRQAVQDRGYIAVKVRVADVIQPRVSRGQDASAWQRAFNRIQAKHFDFVLCSPDGTQCLAVIELDDQSHRQRRRAERDVFLDEAVRSAGLLLIHVPAKTAYSIARLRETLAPLLTESRTPDITTEKTSYPAPAVSADAGDVCPRCGAARVRHDGGSGSLAGKSFWQCSRYPACRYVEPVVN